MFKLVFMAPTAFAPFYPCTQKALAWPPRSARVHGWQSQLSLAVNPPLHAQSFLDLFTSSASSRS